MPSFDYVGNKPETIVGLDPKNISEADYEALPWELQQAVLNNRGSDGNPLYQERPSRSERKRVRDLMGPDPDAVDDPEDASTEPDVPTVAPGDVPPVEVAIPDASLPVDESGRIEPA